MIENIRYSDFKEEIMVQNVKTFLIGIMDN